MPIHDWTRVEDGIFHHFHHRWLTAISDLMNSGLLPPDYYALAEQDADGFGPDVLTLQGPKSEADEAEPSGSTSNGTTRLLVVAPPRVRFTAEASGHRRKRSTLRVRHVSGDRVIAVIEVVSPRNKASRHPFRAMLDKAIYLLEHKVHLLLVDLYPPSKRDPHGLHSSLWEELTDEEFIPPTDKPLTAVSYEAGPTLRAFIEPIALGDALPDMPLFLEPGAHVLIPLEATYQTAYSFVPKRWQCVLSPTA